MCRDRERPTIGAYKNDVTCAALSPRDSVRGGDGFQTFNPPVTGILLHLLEDFVRFAHTLMIL
jgi:hypothetical protein